MSGLVMSGLAKSGLIESGLVKSGLVKSGLVEPGLATVYVGGLGQLVYISGLHQARFSVAYVYTPFEVI